MSWMTSGTGLAIALAVTGAACFAGAAVLQHRAVRSGVRSDVADAVPTDEDGTLSLRGMREVTRQPGWLAGLVLAGAGTTLHALALVMAPLSVIQPIGVLAVPIAVLFTALRTGRNPGAGVFVGVAVCLAGVAMFVLTAAGTAVSSPPPGQSTLIAGLVVAGVVVGLAGFGLTRSGWSRCVACATAGAVAFGLISALVRAVSQSVLHSDVGLVDPPVLGAVVGVVAAILVGGWLVQQAFASGAPEVVVACLTVVDPIVAVLLGAVLLGEGSATSVETWLLLAGAAATATVGVIVLARHHPDAAARHEAAIGAAEIGPTTNGPAKSGPATNTPPAVPSAGSHERALTPARGMFRESAPDPDRR